MSTSAPVVAAKPFSIQLIGPAYPLFQELCVHVRNGYVINRDAPVELFQNGNAMLSLILGNPDEIAISQAKESTAHSVAQEESRYLKDVEEAAKRYVEQEKREALEKQVADAIAASEKAIAKLRKDAEAELAKLNK
jgi:membrane-bound ClpP family serine protease